MFIILTSLTAVYFIYNAFKRRIITGVLIDTAFQDGIYARLKPLIQNIAEAHVSSDIILDRLSNLDLKVQNILKQQYAGDTEVGDFLREPVAVGTSLKFIIKSIFLITATMAAFMFLVNFNLPGMTSYAILLIFVIWWLFITSEYNLWKETSAWTAVFFPILVIPVTVMLLGNLVNYNVLIATMYVTVGLYTFVYYIWAVYATTGCLPIIITKKQEPVESEFFALQQKGLLKEYFDAIMSRLEHKLQEDAKKHESEYAWKK